MSIKLIKISNFIVQMVKLQRQQELSFSRLLSSGRDMSITDIASNEYTCERNLP